MRGVRVKKEGHGEVAFLGDYGRVLLFFCGAGAEVEVEDDGSVGYEAEELGKEFVAVVGNFVAAHDGNGSKDAEECATGNKT